MAAFGSFAGLATAGVGALCGYETDALSMFDFSRPSSSCSRHQHAKAQSEPDGKIDDQRQNSGGKQFSSSRSESSLESPVYTCSP